MAVSFPVIGSLTAFTVTLVLLWVLRPLAPRMDLVDRPGSHRQHQSMTPLIGGLAMFCGFFFAVLTLDLPLSPLRSFFAASALLVVIGILDDLHELSARSRFVAQIAAALLMVFWGGVELIDLGELFSANTLYLGRWSIPLTVFATVGVINALNMSDGMDGQAGSLAFVGLGALAIVTALGGRVEVFNLLVLLTVCVVAFLGFNLRLPGRPRALVFMGDAGSMFLGFTLTWFLITLSQGAERLISPITAVWIVAIPLLDTVTVMLQRILARRSPVTSDRQHIHHLLQAVGLGVGKSWMVITVAAVVFASGGIWAQLHDVSDAVMAYWFAGLFATYFLATNFLWNALDTHEVITWQAILETGWRGMLRAPTTEIARLTHRHRDRRAGSADRRQGDRRSGDDRRSGMVDRRSSTAPAVVTPFPGSRGQV